MICLPFLDRSSGARKRFLGDPTPAFVGGVHRRGAVVLSLLLVLSGAGPTVAAPGATTNAAVQVVDLRPIFARWGLEPRAQGGRNTCSAFAVIGALEYAAACRDRRGTHLSVEFLNWASNQSIGEAQDGGFFSDLWKGFEAYGICPETALPYRAAFDPKLEPSAAALQAARELRAGLRLHWIKPWNPHTGLTEAEFAEIKRVLSQPWPVCAGLRWPKAERWKNDILEMAPPEGVFDGHSVLLAGFRDDPSLPGGGMFFIRNSGRGVREGGMTYEYARTYMNDAVWIDCETVQAVEAGPARTGR